ncbi:MAG TPA: hypothetical protein VK656_00725, partial [Candidatus Acidoferrum sp.]|nr:hypothetical protein [Candidatus Acidoferrum sp.]
GYHQVVRSLEQFTRLLHAAGFDVLGRVPVFATMQPALDLPEGRRRALARRWWVWLEARLRAQPRRGYRLGRILELVDRGVTRVIREGPSTEILAARVRT